MSEMGYLPNIIYLTSMGRQQDTVIPNVIDVRLMEKSQPPQRIFLEIYSWESKKTADRVEYYHLTSWPLLPWDFYTELITGYKWDDSSFFLRFPGTTLKHNEQLMQQSQISICHFSHLKFSFQIFREHVALPNKPLHSTVPENDATFYFIYQWRQGLSQDTSYPSHPSKAKTNPLAFWKRNPLLKKIPFKCLLEFTSGVHSGTLFQALLLYHFV